MIGRHRRIVRILRPAVDKNHRTIQHVQFLKNIPVIFSKSRNDQRRIAEFLGQMIQMRFEDLLRTAAQQKHQTVSPFG